MERQVQKVIQKYKLINHGDNIVIGVSGGPDSMSLLNILNQLKEEMHIKIFVAHINHMMRMEADEETEYVKEFCDKNKIEFFFKKTDVLKVAKENKISTEEAGRNVRYKFFEEVCNITNSNKIATAHNANDNAETVLMNMIRGTGTSGLKGIEPIRDNKFIRPLIKCLRKDIEQYCDKNSLNPKYDKSNEENIYTRNKIRNKLIPYLETNFNPNIIEAINRLSDLAKIETRYLEELTKSWYNIVVTNHNNNEIILDLKKFNSLDFVIKSRMVLFVINKVLGTAQGIEKVNIEDIIKLCDNNIGNKFLMPNKNIKVLVGYGKLNFIKINS